MGRLTAIMLTLTLAAAPLGVRAAPEPATNSTTYSVTQPTDQGHLSQGWGLFATLSGRSMDVGRRDFQWSEDPSVQAHEVEAGYGWRSGATTAVIGYAEHDFGPKYETTAQERQDRDVHRFGGSGVLGLSLVLHGH